MTLLVRDEADIIRTHLEYHFARGVDFVIATDNKSVDETSDVLREFQRRGLLHLIEEKNDDYAQAKWVTRMALLASERYHADWVIHSDADEFWWPRQSGADLKSALRLVPSDVRAIQVTRCNFPPVPELSGDNRPFWKRMVIRERTSLNAVGRPLPPKVCHRGYAGVDVAQGNHEVFLDGEALSRPWDGLEILHFPQRTYAQFANKIRNGGAAYERNRELQPQVGITWRKLYEQYQLGSLPEYYTSEMLEEPGCTQGLRDGTYLFDFRLQDVIRNRTGARRANNPAGWLRRLVARFGRGPEKGIVTLADGNYLEGLKMLHGSVQSTFPVPIHCFDLGLTPAQRDWCSHNLPGVTIAAVPDTAEIRAIREKLDGPPLAKRVKRQWPLWICPFLIAASPYRRTFWLDCDIVVLRHLDKLFGMLDDGPVFTPENNAPHLTPNNPALYELLPIERDFDPLLPAVNGGVSGWDLQRDQEVLQAYMYPVRRALKDRAIKEAISWHDQGCLIWAIQSLGLQHRVLQYWAWNLCVRHTAAAGRHYHWRPGVLDSLRSIVQEANLLHWNGSTVPWHLPAQSPGPGSG